MYTVVRQYTNAGELVDMLAKRSEEVNEIIGSVPGFVAYYGIRDGDNFTSISICNDRAGADETTRRAAAWVKENLPDTSMSAPDIRQGEVFLEFTA